MIVARPFLVAGVPTLVATPSTTDALGPVVIWVHGFRADALGHARELERCAAMGFLAVGIDAVHHGARRDPQLSDRVARSPNGAMPIVLDIVEQTMYELPALVAALVADHGADATRVSMVGVSMGAFLVYRAISLAFPLRAAVALLGSPEWSGPSSPHLSLAAFTPVPLLSITAEHDVSVPPGPAKRLHAALTAGGYGSPPSAHAELRGAGHLTSATEWEQAMQWTLEWVRSKG